MSLQAVLSSMNITRDVIVQTVLIDNTLCVQTSVVFCFDIVTALPLCRLASFLGKSWHVCFQRASSFRII